ncbi:unnamed protein product [Boreogadus saida]
MNCSRVPPSIWSYPPAAHGPGHAALPLPRPQPLYPPAHHVHPPAPQSPARARQDPQRPGPARLSLLLLSSSSNSTPSSSPDSSLTWEPRSSLRSCLRRRGGGAVRKRVMFADAWGLALAEVRLFVPEPAQNTVFGTLSRSRHQFKNNQLPCSPLAAKPQVPAAKPQVPAAKPQVPAEKPQVPAAKQQVPAAKQQVPAAKQQVPAAKQQVPAAKQQVPAAKAQLPAPSPAPGSPSLNAAAGERRQYPAENWPPRCPPRTTHRALKDARVQLESASVTERGLMGTVRVACSSRRRRRGGGPLHVRLTFDSWRKPPGRALHPAAENCGNTQTDVFAFPRAAAPGAARPPWSGAAGNWTSFDRPAFHSL